MSKVKFRPVMKMFMQGGTTCVSKYCIEILYGGRTAGLLGDGTDTLKFDSMKERDAYLEDIRNKVANSAQENNVIHPDLEV